MWERVELEETAGKATYAYVCLVYGHRDDIIGQAIACCNSIHKTGTNYPVVCMYTNDVPQHHITILNAIFDHTVRVPIIYGASSLYKKDWFKEVFTKLHIFNPHGRQDKYIARKLYNRLPCEVQDLAYQRAQAAWGDFNINLAEAAITVRDNLKDNHHQLLNNNTMVHGYYETFIERSGMRGLLYWGDVTGDAAATSPTIHSDDDDDDEDDDDDDDDDEWYADDDADDDDGSSVNGQDQQQHSNVDSIIRIGVSYRDHHNDEWVLVKILPKDGYACLFLTRRPRANNSGGERRQRKQSLLSFNVARRRLLQEKQQPDEGQ
ncbi:hypothetical protein FOZ60_010261 [Perkinsus olseni]|uniref:Uncharacterized protein n=1 Tax=Perkinsus olseni TaxID=32597 RepID=A0A7J6NFL3_PEROL|nr:hypothetical protein FOZ60_010261 [Perkinsus olseni]